MDSYDFSSESNNHLITEENKDIINSAVLGLIFEKLNGYKDGSFYTPGFITEYMAKESIERAVVEKFNEALAIEAKDINEVKNYIGRVYKKEEFIRHNNIVNSLKVLDPAVGSGHFLVSVLNHIIYLKSYLGILWDGDVKVENSIDIFDDTLIVFTENDTPFTYKKADRSTHILQKTLFNEKKTIIENCLFAADINPKSVYICQLRLWIELLKNTYYINNSYEMDVLPNIDINIKTGNSLISKFPIKIGKSAIADSKKLKGDIKDYKKAVSDYKSSGDKQTKQKVKNKIADIKRQLVSVAQYELFSGNKKLIDENIYKNSMEWMIEFPEVLNENGEFQGFDVVIGNPPYIKEYDNRHAFDGLRESSYFQGKMDLWYFFVCCGLELIKDKGFLNFIAPNNWITNAGASILRNTILSNSKIVDYIDFNNFKVFDEANIQTMILGILKEKDSNYDFDYFKAISHNLKIQDVICFLSSKKAEDCFEEILVNVDKEKMQNKTITFIKGKFVNILDKMTRLANYYFEPSNITNGIHHHHDIVNKDRLKVLGDSFSVGDGIFLLSNTEKQSLSLSGQEENLLKPSYNTKQLQRYFVNKQNEEWVVYTDSRFKNITKIEAYPNIKRHLDKFEAVITSDNAPYGLHRARKEEFFKNEKIIVQRKCSKQPIFTYTDFDCYVSATFNIIQPKDINLKYLTALLNSSLITFWLKNKGKMQGNNYQVDKEPLLNIPIIKTDNCEIEKRLINLVDDVLLQGGNIELEAEIDQIVYELYGLTEEEIKIVEQD